MCCRVFTPMLGNDSISIDFNRVLSRIVYQMLIEKNVSQNSYLNCWYFIRITLIQFDKYFGINDESMVIFIHKDRHLMGLELAKRS